MLLRHNVHLFSFSFTKYQRYKTRMQALRGTDQEVVRWRSCVNLVNLKMGVAVGRMYVERYFSKDARENVSTEYTVFAGVARIFSRGALFPEKVDDLF